MASKVSQLPGIPRPLLVEIRGEISGQRERMAKNQILEPGARIRKPFFLF